MNSDIIYLDIGGELFRTTRSTLSSGDENSFFTRMFGDNAKWSECREGTTKDTAIFIDRDPSAFPHILSYLRSRQVVFPLDTDIGTLQQILIEADFYQLEELSKATQEEIAHKREQITAHELANGPFIYRTVISAQANDYFERGWQYVNHYLADETIGCQAPGTIVCASKVNNHCSVCGELVIGEKFYKHVSRFNPMMVVIRINRSYVDNNNLVYDMMKLNESF